MLLEAILISIILSMTCWAAHEAAGEDQLLQPLVERFEVLKNPLITGCPKCMPTLWMVPVFLYIYLTIVVTSYAIFPLAWITSSGVNALIIKILDND